MEGHHCKGKPNLLSSGVAVEEDAQATRRRGSRVFGGERLASRGGDAAELQLRANAVAGAAQRAAREEAASRGSALSARHLSIPARPRCSRAIALLQLLYRYRLCVCRRKCFRLSTFVGYRHDKNRLLYGVAGLTRYTMKAEPRLGAL